MTFPGNPTNGQTTVQNNVTFVYSSSKDTWSKIAGTSGTFDFSSASSLTVSNTLSVTGNANVGNLGAATVVATNLTGSLTTSSQPNVTSVGTLSSVTVSGNANVGNIGGATAVLTVAANVPLVQNGNSNISVDANSHVRISANGTANIVFVAANGNVGVGTASPVTKLDVSGSSAQNIVAVAASAIDCSAGNYFTKTASGALTWTFTNVPASRSFIFALELTNGGAGTQTWPASVVWDGGSAPTLQTSGTDIIVFITSNGGTTWRAVRGWKQA